MGCINSKSGNNKNTQQQQQNQQQSEEVVQGQVQQKQQKQKQGLLDQGIQKAQNAKSEYDLKKQEKWINEVLIKETNLFKEVRQWFELYEPKGQQNQGNKKDGGLLGQDMIMKVAKENMKKTLSQTIMKTILEQIARLLDTAAKLIRPHDEQVYSVINAFVATILTYRFQYKNSDKFSYLRGKTIDRLGFTFVHTLDHEARKLDSASQEPVITEDLINKVIDKYVQIIMNKILERKQEIVKKVKEHSLFAMSGVQESQLDEGVQQIFGAMEAYGEKKN